MRNKIKHRRDWSANDWNLTLRFRRFPCLTLLPVLDYICLYWHSIASTMHWTIREERGAPSLNSCCYWHNTTSTMHGAKRKQHNPPFYDSFCSPISLWMIEKNGTLHIWLSFFCITISDEEDFDLPSLSRIPTLY